MRVWLRFSSLAALSVVAGCFVEVRALGQEQSERDYQALLQLTKNDPARADWTALRLAFSRTNAYRPRRADRPELASLEQELANGEKAAATVALDRMMQDRWVDVEAHWLAAAICERIGNPERARMHMAFARGLLSSIRQSGNGSSPASAWTVVCIEEERLMLEELGLAKTDRSILKTPEHVYAVHTFQNKQANRKVSVYFNVDVSEQWAETYHDPVR